MIESLLRAHRRVIGSAAEAAKRTCDSRRLSLGPSNASKTAASRHGSAARHATPSVSVEVVVWSLQHERSVDFEEGLPIAVGFFDVANLHAANPVLCQLERRRKVLVFQ